MLIPQQLDYSFPNVIHPNKNHPIDLEHLIPL